MIRSSKLLLTGLTAALLLAAMVSSASANRLSVSNQAFRVVFTPLTFQSSEEGGVQVRCNVTLEGSFHTRTIVKTANSLIGHISRASLNSCSGGTATILQASLPWHVQYRSFTGTLPNITGVVLGLVGAAFLLDTALADCLYQSTAASPAVGTVNISSGRATTLTASERFAIPIRTSLSVGCAFAQNGFFTGSGTVTLLGNTTVISVTLI
jgi:hypothetical protein